MPLEKTGIINVLCIFTDFDLFFLPKCTVNPGESWHRKSYVYPEEESHVNSEGIVFMPVEKQEMISVLMHTVTEHHIINSYWPYLSNCKLTLQRETFLSCKSL